MSTKTILLGLDGGTWNLLNTWISNGRLKTFKQIIDSGSVGILKSTVPCLTIPALPSLLTGTNPGRHGILSFTKPNGVPVTLKEMKYPRLWNILDECGFKSCIVGVRATFPPEIINGVMISGSVPSDKSDYTYPNNIKEKFKFEDDDHEKKILDLRKKKKDKNFRMELVNLIKEQTERRYNIFKKLNQEETFDFTMYWIEETDLIQHLLWEYPDSLLHFYNTLDNILKDLLMNFPDRNLFIVSDHGFEASPSRYFFVNSWLKEGGYLRLNTLVPAPLFNFGLNSAFKAIGILARGRAWRFERLTSLLIRMRSSEDKDLRNKEFIVKRIVYPGIDRKKSNAYLLTPFGIKVNNSINYELIREEIIEKLLEVKNQQGEKVFKNVWKKEDIYEGEYLNEIPDIVFLNSEVYTPFPTVTRKLFSTIAGKRAFWWRSGGHVNSRDGIFLACGPVIRKGHDLGTAAIEDIFPTILHLMACSIPDHVTGKILMNVFEEDSESAKRKPIFKKVDTSKINLELEKEDSEKIRQKLRDLGYI